MASGRPKQLLELAGRPVLIRALSTLAALRDTGLREVVLSHPADHATEFESLLDRFCAARPGFVFAPPGGGPCPAEKSACHLRITPGGETRQSSVHRALERMNEDVELVYIHDAVRPFATLELYHRLREALRLTEAPGAVPLLPMTDTVKRVSRGPDTGEPSREVLGTVDRESLAAVQTPQLFRRRQILDLHRRAAGERYQATDDCALLERYLDKSPVGIEGERGNIKLTRPEDFRLAELLIAGGMTGTE